MRSELKGSLLFHPEGWSKEGLEQLFERWDKAASGYFDAFLSAKNPTPEPASQPNCLTCNSGRRGYRRTIPDGMGDYKRCWDEWHEANITPVSELSAKSEEGQLPPLDRFEKIARFSLSEAGGYYAHELGEWVRASTFAELVAAYRAALSRAGGESALESWERAFQHASRHGWVAELDGIPPYVAPKVEEGKR